MKITVVVKPNSRGQSVRRLADGSLEVRVHAPAVEGRANEAGIVTLAKFLSVPKSALSIVRGGRGRKKIIEIAE